MLELVLEENGVNIRSTHLRPHPLNAPIAPTQAQLATPARVEEVPSTAQDTEMDEGVYLWYVVSSHSASAFAHET